MAETIVITEVGPRDGLQNQPRALTPAQRVQLIQALLAAGLSSIEVGSFVSPQAVPAMAQTDVVIANLPRKTANYSVLVPNQKGYEMARAAGIKTIGAVVAASNTFNEKNIRMSTAQAFALVLQLIEQGRADGVDVLANIAMAWECPYEGAIDSGVVIDMAAQLLAAGAARVVICDTSGAAHPGAVKSLLHALTAQFGEEPFGCHFHDTRGMALANVYAALEGGIRHFDASIGGLGGCPFSPGAGGNVATEDVALLLEKMGFATGIDLDKLASAAELAAALTAGNSPGGHSLRWLQRQREQGRL